MIATRSPKLDAGHLSDFKHEEQERLPRQQAAERLINIARAFTAGGPLELSAAGRRITVPVASDLRLELSHKPRRQPIPFSPVTAHPRAAVTSQPCRRRSSTRSSATPTSCAC
jgi:amphi-Trp domain-containing protein